jgi:hypothetical protein
MSSTLRKAFLVCLLGIFIIFLSASQVSAQETGTLIVYEEAQGGDSAFSFSGSGSMGNFQISTEDNGGAKVFDVPSGTYTVTQNSLPSGWSTQEVFADGTGAFSTDVSQSKATFTVSSPADFIYLRFTNTKASTNPTPAGSPSPSPSIPENIGLPLLLVMVAVVTSVLVVLSKKKKQVAPVMAILLSVLMVTAFIGQVQANPDKYIQMGTKGTDYQEQFGTPGKEVIVQLGFGGDDTQYGEGAADDDWIIQNGGSGKDDMTAIGGDGNNCIIQEGGDGADIMFGAMVGQWIGLSEYLSNGGKGDDDITVGGGTGNCEVTVYGGEGNDTIHVSVGPNAKDDSIRIEAGSGNDTLRYDLSSGKDSVFIDGGSENDFLTINKNHLSFQLLDSNGLVLYLVGSGGSTITVVNVEGGEVVGDDGKVAFQW